MEIVRLRCEQLPGVPLLGIESRKEYLAHVFQFIGFLKGSSSWRTNYAHFRSFIQSADGRELKESGGGELSSAVKEGSLNKMVYYYRLNKQGDGHPSMFVTVGGMLEIMYGLPGVDASMKNMLKGIFVDYLTQPESLPTPFKKATIEQCKRDDDDELVGLLGSAPPTVSNDGMVISHKLWLDINLDDAKLAADKRVLEARLEAKDSVIAANDSLKVAEIAKERAEKEMVQKELDHVKESAAKELDHAAKELDHVKESAAKELDHVKESAAKDLQIAQLQMKLDLTEEKARLRAEFMASRVERNEERDKVQRTAGLPKKIHARDTMFAKQVSDFWNNDEDGVHMFVKLSDRGVSSSIAWEPITVMPELVVRLFSNELPVVDTKQRVFGFCFRGPAITETSLKSTDLIKEAYGVEEDGVQFVCFVLFKSAGQLLSAVPTLPYALGLLPNTIVADTVRDYQLAVYRTGVSTDDPVLRMLKRPSTNKWIWHSSVRRDV
jgi:hypothetical protein